MPIYEYRCNSCGNELDALQKVSDQPLLDCPECGAAALRRLISAPSFRLKGSGWYETDFKSDKERKRNIAEAPDKKSGDSDKAASADGGNGKAKDAPSGGAKSDSGGSNKDEKPSSTSRGEKGSSSAVA